MASRPVHGLSAQIKKRTAGLHLRAERTGFIRGLLRNQVSVTAYALYLRNLLPAYLALESGIQKNREVPELGAFAVSHLFRAGALERDLRGIVGSDWSCFLPLLPSGSRYAQRVACVADQSPSHLLGHAYVRYLGDLSGGQILKRHLAKSLSLAPNCLNFYDFSPLGDLECFKDALRDAIDHAGERLSDPNQLILEAAEAFTLNIGVSIEVQEFLSREPARRRWDQALAVV